MQEPAISSTSAATIAAAALLSLIALFALFQRHIQAKPLLAYEPRQRVPWGSWATIISLFYVLQAFVQWLGKPEESLAEINPSDFIVNGWWYSAVAIGFVVFGMAGLAAALDANAQDLGFPRHARQLVVDIGIGCFACVASMVPVFAIHLVLTVVFKPQQQHQLIEQLQQHQSPQMLLVGVAVAVIAAPLFEEFAFRLLLQGWLERWEDQMLGFRDSQRNESLP